MAISFLALIIFYLVVFVPIGAIILRGAVSLANRFLPANAVPQQVSDVAQAVPDEQEVQRDLSNPFTPPAAANELYRGLDVAAIPEPRFGRAYLITLVQAILSFIVGIGFRVATGDVPIVVGQGLAVLVYFGIACLVFSLMAPTSYLRSIVVMVIVFVILIALVALAGGVIALVMART